MDDLDKFNKLKDEVERLDGEPVGLASYDAGFLTGINFTLEAFEPITDSEEMDELKEIID